MFGFADYPEDTYVHTVPTDEWMWTAELPTLLPPSVEFASASSPFSEPFGASFGVYDSWERSTQPFLWPPEPKFAVEPAPAPANSANVALAFNYSYQEGPNFDSPSPPPGPLPLPFPHVTALVSLVLSLASMSPFNVHPGSETGSPSRDDNLKLFHLDSRQADRPPAPLVAKLLELYPNHATKLPKSVSCCHCKEQFSTTLDYAAHLDAHSVAVQHTCPVADCPFSYLGFSKKGDLRIHVFNAHFKKKKGLKHHRPDTEGDHLKSELSNLLYICENHHCLRPFYRRDSLTRHMRLVHKVNPTNFNPRAGRKSSCDTPHRP